MDIALVTGGNKGIGYEIAAAGRPRDDRGADGP
jgi:NAD(P)-dependent dehydrogenase (short-subunit alcohol dehydrogenase family)